jgi:hypothetical protein
MAWMPAYIAVRNLLSMISMVTTRTTIDQFLNRYTWLCDHYSVDFNHDYLCPAPKSIYSLYTVIMNIAIIDQQQS